MKKLVFGGVAIACALGLCIASEAQAARRGGSRGQSETGADQTERRESGGQRDEGQHQFAKMRTEKITRELGLDAATSAKVDDIFKRQMEQRKTLMTNYANEVAKLKQLSDAKASSAAISAQIDRVESVKAQLRATEPNAFAELRTLLGTENTAKLLIMQSEEMSRMRERMSGNMRGGSDERGDRGNRGNRDEREKRWQHGEGSEGQNRGGNW